MQVHRLSDPYSPLPNTPRAVALGLFDGVHLGHRRVISGAVGADGLCASVFTFGRSAAALKPNACSLCTKAQKQRIFEILGVDEWLQADFDAYRELSPEDFVHLVLVNQLHAARVCCGTNFRFGRGGTGDVTLLKTLCKKHGIEVVAADELCDEHGPLSSDRIRRLIEAGDMLTASRLLGHSFALEFPIVHGHQLGRTIGSPTANQVLPPHFVHPRAGVYASTVVIDGKTYYGVSNVGVHPTVGAEIPTCETWIEEFNGDIYGRTLSVVLTHFIRDEQHFPSLEALKAQIRTDRDTARQLRESDDTKAIFFDFDDTLQNRPVAFRRFAEYFLDHYRPDAAPHEREELIRIMAQLNHGGYVDYLTFFTEMPLAIGISDPPDAAVLFKEYQRVFPSYVHLFDKALDTLCALRHRGYRIGIITNGPLVQQHRKLDYAGLRLLCDTIVVSSEEEVAKPNPEIFCRAAARLGFSPAQCVMVGDHPLNDIDGAVAAGMRAIFLDTTHTSCREGVPVVHKPYDILPLLP